MINLNKKIWISIFIIGLLTGCLHDDSSDNEETNIVKEEEILPPGIEVFGTWSFTEVGMGSCVGEGVPEGEYESGDEWEGTFTQNGSEVTLLIRRQTGDSPDGTAVGIMSDKTFTFELDASHLDAEYSGNITYNETSQEFEGSVIWSETYISNIDGKDTEVVCTENLELTVICIGSDCGVTVLEAATI